MFWIMGGELWVAALAGWTGWPALEVARRHLEHAAWDGFRFYDLVFPLFLFIAGVAIPFSFEHRRARGDARRRLVQHVAKRVLGLVGLGVLYNALWLVDFEQRAWPAFDDPRYASVLARIGLGYGGAALIVLFFRLPAQIAWAAGLLLAYWMALVWIPVPGYGAGNLEPGATLGDYLDRRFLPGRLYHVVRDPEGLLSTFPAVSTALLGVFSGRWIRQDHRTSRDRLLGLLGAGVLALVVGGLWDGVLPINKNLWSSSFVLWCAGWSVLLLAGAYWATDLCGERVVSGFFRVIGKNSILVYMLTPLIPAWFVAHSLLGDEPGDGARVAFLLVFVLGKWGLLWALDRRGWYLKV